MQLDEWSYTDSNRVRRATLFGEGEVNIAEYLPRQSRGKYSAIATEPEGNNCFSIIFKGECEKIEVNWAKHEKQMRLSLAIMPRNPIITARVVIIMQNCYIHLWKLYYACMVNVRFL